MFHTLMSLIVRGNISFLSKNCKNEKKNQDKNNILKKVKVMNEWSDTFCSLLVKRNNVSYNLTPPRVFKNKFSPPPTITSSPTIHFSFYKNLFYKNHEAEICKTLKTFSENWSDENTYIPILLGLWLRGSCFLDFITKL